MTAVDPSRWKERCAAAVSRLLPADRSSACSKVPGCFWQWQSLACGLCVSEDVKASSDPTLGKALQDHKAITGQILAALGTESTRECGAKHTKADCSSANDAQCKSWEEPPRDVKQKHPRWVWWRAAQDGTPYCCTDALDKDGKPSLDAADGFDDTDMLKNSYTIVYQDCPDRGTTLGASLGYAGLFELAITIIVLPLLMYSGVLNRDGKCHWTHSTKSGRRLARACSRSCHEV